jgi:hypothetical protein
MAPPQSALVTLGDEAAVAARTRTASPDVAWPRELMAMPASLACFTSGDGVERGGEAAVRCGSGIRARLEAIRRHEFMHGA